MTEETVASGGVSTINQQPRRCTMGAIALVVTVAWPILWPVLLAVVGGALAIGVTFALCERIAPSRRSPERPRLRCAEDIAFVRQRAEERRRDFRHR